ncbi:MAG: hypothetical protein ABIJ15_03450 [bacterium]
MKYKFLSDEIGQGETEYVIMIFCLLGVITFLKIFNLYVNKAYLDAMNRIRQW